MENNQELERINITPDLDLDPSIIELYKALHPILYTLRRLKRQLKDLQGNKLTCLENFMAELGLTPFYQFGLITLILAEYTQAFNESMRHLDTRFQTYVNRLNEARKNE